MLANLLQDVRYALHGFALRPMFAVVVVLTLAVGIGVNVAVFSLFDRIMLRELNVAQSARAREARVSKRSMVPSIGSATSKGRR